MITFVTGNQNKLKEVQMLLGTELTSLKLDLLEIQGTYAEIIAHKVKSAAEVVNGPAVVDDAGLEFEAMGSGLPGPYVKWFLEQLGPDGLVRMLEGFDNKGAYAVCTVGYCEGPGKATHVFQGRTRGSIVAPRGAQTFGWDCIFEPEGLNVTYAEMEKSEKNKISHRGRAFTALREHLGSA